MLTYSWRIVSRHRINYIYINWIHMDIDIEGSHCSKEEGTAGKLCNLIHFGFNFWLHFSSDAHRSLFIVVGLLCVISYSPSVPLPRPSLHLPAFLFTSYACSCLFQPFLYLLGFCSLSLSLYWLESFYFCLIFSVSLAPWFAVLRPVRMWSFAVRCRRPSCPVQQSRVTCTPHCIYALCVAANTCAVITLLRLLSLMVDITMEAHMKPLVVLNLSWRKEGRKKEGARERERGNKKSRERKRKVRQSLRLIVHQGRLLAHFEYVPPLHLMTIKKSRWQTIIMRYLKLQQMNDTKKINTRMKFMSPKLRNLMRKK